MGWSRLCFILMVALPGVGAVRLGWDGAFIWPDWSVLPLEQQLALSLILLGIISGLVLIGLLGLECRKQRRLRRAETERGERLRDELELKIRELELQLKVVTAERQHAEAIIYSISDAVLVTDPFDEVVLANESAARTFDFELAAVERRPVDALLRDRQIVDLIREMRQSQSRRGRRVVERRVETAGGERTFKVTLSSVSDQADEPAGVVAVLHDMTREKEIAQMKTDFVSNVSHELRTPLASIKAYVEMLIDGEAEDARTAREFYEVIQGEANRLGRLIDNILNVSRVESGLVKINKQPMSLVVIVKEAVEVIAPQAKMKRITIDERLAPVSDQALVDRDMMYQAVLNLLANAVKYTPEGGTIRVELTVEPGVRSQGPGAGIEKSSPLAPNPHPLAPGATLRITDTGIGIPPKDLPFVFDKFYRVERNNKMAKGTGLGLPLVKHVIEVVHQGRVFVESELNKGSCFGFELDLHE